MHCGRERGGGGGWQGVRRHAGLVAERQLAILTLPIATDPPSPRLLQLDWVKESKALIKGLHNYIAASV